MFSKYFSAEERIFKKQCSTMIHHPALPDSSRDLMEAEDSEHLPRDSWCKGHFGDKGLDE